MSLRRTKLQVGLAFFAFILIGANDGAFGVLIPGLSMHYRVDKATIGLVFFIQTLGYLVSAFNSGLLVERLGNRRFLIMGVTAFLLSVGVLSFMPPFAFVLVCMLPLGFGVAVLDAGLNAFIASLPRNTALLNYLHAFYGAGALLGPVIASALLAVNFSWNSVYTVWVGVSLVLLIGFQLVFKRQPASARRDEAKSASNVLATALKIRVVWMAALFLLVYVGTEVSLGSWSFSFLTEERHTPILLSGWAVSGYWCGLTLGRLAMARVAQWIGSERMIQTCLVGVVAGVLLNWLVPFYMAAVLSLVLIGFSLGPIYPTTIALISGRISARILATAIGFLASMGSIGAAVFPGLAGMLAERLGLWSLMPYIILLTIILVCLWQALRTHPSAPESSLRSLHETDIVK